MVEVWPTGHWLHGLAYRDDFILFRLVLSVSPFNRFQA
jgi:hypothetical protein